MDTLCPPWAVKMNTVPLNRCPFAHFAWLAETNVMYFEHMTLAVYWKHWFAGLWRVHTHSHTEWVLMKPDYSLAELLALSGCFHSDGSRTITVKSSSLWGRTGLEGASDLYSSLCDLLNPTALILQVFENQYLQQVNYAFNRVDLKAQMLSARIQSAEAGIYKRHCS